MAAGLVSILVEPGINKDRGISNWHGRGFSNNVTRRDREVKNE